MDTMSSNERGDLEPFEQCLDTKFSSAHAFKEVDARALRYWLLGYVTFEPWSGVREKHFRVTKDLAFLRPPSASDGLWPFDFIVQITFTSPPVNLPERKQEQYMDQRPIEFDSIKQQIEQLVSVGIAQNDQQPMFDDLRNFTVLQRLFRTAFKGHFGDHFPVEKLASLERLTAGGIPYFHTARWNGSEIEEFKELMSLDDNAAEPWLKRAAMRGEQCLRFLEHFKGNLPDGAIPQCDFSEFQSPARSACNANTDESNEACAWAHFSARSTTLVSLWEREQAFGVLKDVSLDHPRADCPALRPLVDYFNMMPERTR